MSKKHTVLSLFCGAGGKTQGAIDAGYLPIGAIDNWQPAIEAYRQNISGQADCLNLLDCKPHRWSRPSLLMASPPCPNFSKAKVGAKETLLDLALAGKVAEFAGVLKPKAIIIENVPDYLRSKACRFLLATLRMQGYLVHCDILVAADLGAPQTRRRLIIRAFDPKRARLEPIKLTHNRTGKDGLKPWVGWYESIADLIPTLPESKLTDRQLASVAATSGNCQLIQRVGYYGKVPKSWDSSEPVGTIRAALGTDGKGNKRSHYMDCWIASGGWNTTPRLEENPCKTTIASSKGRTRALISGEGRSITPRALQRLQGLPDSWELPEDPRLSVRMIGNSVVPIVAESAVRSIGYL
jgi:DNA (cytosine-5)-methyltransferase 1